MTADTEERVARRKVPVRRFAIALVLLAVLALLVGIWLGSRDSSLPVSTETPQTVSPTATPEPAAPANTSGLVRLEDTTDAEVREVARSVGVNVSGKTKAELIEEIHSREPDRSTARRGCCRPE
jgi:hypothetical protein